MSKENSFFKPPVYFILATTILILILQSTSFGKIDVLIPTGNIDIFDIVIKDDCECNECDVPAFIEDDKPDNSEGNKPSNPGDDKPDNPGDDNPDNPGDDNPDNPGDDNPDNPGDDNPDNPGDDNPDNPGDDNPDNPGDDNPSKPEDDKPEEDGKLSVFDEQGDFSNQKELNIFSNPAFEMKSIIAPGSSNAYQFVIRNNNNFNIQYGIKMNETNDYGINMKYRLKQDGNYIIGDENTWVTADELVIEKVKLASKSKIPYLLEWKWFDSTHDTEIGKIDNADYKLSIQIVASSI